MHGMNGKRRQLRPYHIPRIAEVQATRGWTNQRLAALAGVSPATVGRLLSGQTQSRRTVKAVAEALGMDLAELVVPADAEPARKTQEEPAA